MPRVGNTLHFEPNTKMQNIILSSVGKMWLDDSKIKGLNGL
jgi:hypothetical protein